MRTYCIVFVRPRGRDAIEPFPQLFDAVDDRAALEVARNILSEYEMEIWENARLVARLPGRIMAEATGSTGMVEMPTMRMPIGTREEEMRRVNAGSEQS